MASFLNLYNEIEYKIKEAIIQNNQYKLENKQLIRENEQLKEQIVALKEQMIECQEKYNLLVITQTVLKKTDKQETKKKINDLMREIDNCMMLLKKE